MPVAGVGLFHLLPTGPRRTPPEAGRIRALALDAAPPQE